MVPAAPVSLPRSRPGDEHLDGTAARSHAPSSHTETLTVVVPRTGWAPLQLSELWRHRRLVGYFVWRDLKVRYKQTALGVLWAVLQPLLATVVFTVAFGRIEGLSPTSVPYPAFVLAGMVPWILFSTALSGASQSVVSHQTLITKVYFPRAALPLASVGAAIADFVPASLLLIACLAWYGVSPGVTAIWGLAFALFAAVTAVAAGFFLSALNVQYRDVRHMLPFVTQLWLYATPVVYAATIIAPQWHVAYALNPMVTAIEGFRWAVLGTPFPDASTVIASLSSATVMLLCGAWYFRSMERTFADVV